MRPRRGDTAREGAHVAAMQRRRLLHAFCEIVGESGLERAGIGRVCKRAGVSRRTFYDLFEDREACFLAALDGAFERMAAFVRDACDGELTWEERINHATDALLTLFDRDRATARMCVVETLRGGPRALDRRASALAMLARAVDEGREVAAREGMGAPSPLTAESVVGGALSVIHTRLLDRADAPLSPLAEPLAEMIVRPYLGARVGSVGANGRRPTGTTRLAKGRRRAQERRRGEDGAQRAGAADVPDVGAPVGSRPAVDDTSLSLFDNLAIRVTYRTAMVIATIAENPGASSRSVGERAGIADQGQASKLLRRLCRHGLIEHQLEARGRGEAYAWALTDRGRAVHETLST